MRRDILELDTSIANEIREGLSLQEMESVRLMLSGGSVIDWQRLAFENLEQVDAFLARQLLDMSDPDDVQRLRYVFNEAVAYLEENLQLRFPKDLRDPPDVREVFLIASQFGGFRRRQILSCAILKLMHVIHHMEAADLKYKTPMAEEAYFDLAHTRILQYARRMQEAGLPVQSFYGSRKSRSSIITKLLAKKETLAATVFDKLRFRIVVRHHDDLIPVLVWLHNNVFAFNYCIPGQSHNNLLDPRELIGALRQLDVDMTQDLADMPPMLESGKNEFSSSSYRMINFIVDFPVKIPTAPAGTASLELGKVVFVMVEFQIVDERTAQANEEGDGAHHLYKERQQEVVGRRLKRGRHKNR